MLCTVFVQLSLTAGHTVGKSV